MNKIRTNEVLKYVVNVYKENARMVLKMSAIQVMISYGIIMSSIIVAQIPQESLGLLLLAGLFRLIFVLFAVYFINRMFATLALFYKHNFHGEGGSMGDFYREAAPVTWRCIGHRFLLGLMYVLPVLIVIVGIALPMVEGFDIPIAASIITCAIGGIPILILMVLFYFVLVVTVVYRYPKSTWGYSIKLLKGNLFPVIMLVLIGSVTVVYPYVFTMALGVSNHTVWVQAILYLIEMIPTWLLLPFFAGLPVVSMQMIEEGNQKPSDGTKKEVEIAQMGKFDYLQ